MIGKVELFYLTTLILIALKLFCAIRIIFI